MATDTFNNTEALSIEYTPKWIATLVRGAYYDLRGEVFTAGFPKPCFDFQKVHLEEHAVHVVDTPGWSAEYDDESTRATMVPMFEFRPNDGSADGALPLTAPASARMRSFDEAERMRHARNAERTAALSDYSAPAAIDAAREAAAPQRDADTTDADTAPRARPRKFPARPAV